MTPRQQAFVAAFLATLEEPERYRASAIQPDMFCDNRADADECARLVDQGIKRASCSLLAAYEIEGIDRPAPGAFTLVVDWAQNPVCVIVTTQVEIAPFDQVSAEFAYLEGEGDRSLAQWRETHRRYFERAASQLGISFSPQDLLLLEQFEKVYPL
ncbi:ASCH domain-containing protein [Salinicola endophyticus]|nr:ASCH domain-containing protein [Salinicola endophyticus]